MFWLFWLVFGVDLACGKIWRHWNAAWLWPYLFCPHCWRTLVLQSNAMNVWICCINTLLRTQVLKVQTMIFLSLRFSLFEAHLAVSSNATGVLASNWAIGVWPFLWLTLALGCSFCALPPLYIIFGRSCCGGSPNWLLFKAKVAQTPSMRVLHPALPVRV